MPPLEDEFMDWTVFAETRLALGPNFIRILGYFREDGTRSVRKIEEAMRVNDPVPMVDAAHSLKGESLQFGALRLSDTAERIEMTARACVNAGPPRRGFQPADRAPTKPPAASAVWLTGPLSVYSAGFDCSWI